MRRWETRRCSPRPSLASESALKLVDANVLLYAVNPAARHSEVARTWLDRALTGRETVLIPWVSVLAFIRLSTNATVFERPLTTDQAFDVVDGWLGRSNVVVPEPDRRQSARVRELLADTGSGGNLVNDAHLAALALQLRAQVVTFDSDFGRFPGVSWVRPAGD